MNFSTIEGLTIVSIKGMDQGSGEIVFTTSDDRQFRMYHYQSCCESVRLEDVVGDVEDLLDTPVLRAEERSSGAQDCDYGIEQWTFYTIATIHGTVDLRWYGESNGYYSTDVTFEEMSKNSHE